MENKLPTRIANPNGLHQKYQIKKIVVVPGTLDYSDRNGGNRSRPTLKLKPVDKAAEYFVLRLDMNGDDLHHVKACRIAIQAYANEIQKTIPLLAKDLKERYPLI